MGSGGQFSTPIIICEVRRSALSFDVGCAVCLAGFVNGEVPQTGTLCMPTQVFDASIFHPAFSRRPVFKSGLDIMKYRCLSRGSPPGCRVFSPGPSQGLFPGVDNERQGSMGAKNISSLGRSHNMHYGNSASFGMIYEKHIRGVS